MCSVGGDPGEWGLHVGSHVVNGWVELRPPTGGRPVGGERGGYARGVRRFGSVGCHSNKLVGDDLGDWCVGEKERDRKGMTRVNGGPAGRGERRGSPG